MPASDYDPGMSRDAETLPASGVVEVWYQRVAEVGSEATDADLELLSPDEKALHAGLQARARLEYGRAHALLRRVLSRHLPLSPEALVFESDDDGRPRLANAPPDAGLDFNLSHTDGLVACAVTRSGRVGVDVEALDLERDLDRVVERVLGHRERDWWHGLRPEDRALGFLDLWTLKEAHFKASSKGVRWPFSSLEFEIESEFEASRLEEAGARIEEAPWHYTRRAPTPRHRLAVAFQGRAKPSWRISVFPD